MGKAINISKTANIKVPGVVDVGVTANTKNGVELDISKEYENEVKIDNNININNSLNLDVKVNSNTGISGNLSFSNEIYRDIKVDFSNDFLSNVNDLSALSIISMTNVLNTLPKGSSVNVKLGENGAIIITGIDYNAKVGAEVNINLPSDLITIQKKENNPNTIGVAGDINVGASATYIYSNGAVIAGRVEFDANAHIDFNLERFIQKFKDIIRDGLDSNVAIKMKPEGSLGVSVVGTYYQPPKFSFNPETGIMDVSQRLISGSYRWETNVKLGGSINLGEKGKVEEIAIAYNHSRFKGSIKNKDFQNPFDYICSVNQIAELKVIEYNIIRFAPYAYKVPELNLRTKITTDDVLKAGRIAVDAGKSSIINYNPRPVKFNN